MSARIRVLTAILAIVPIVVLASQAAHGVPASPEVVLERQPDGSVVELRIRGDERFHWTEDRDGFTVVRRRGWFRYADLDSRGQLVDTDLIVGRHHPAAAGLRKRMLPEPAMRQLSPLDAKSSTAPEAAVPTTGRLANLVVLLRFSNHATRSVPSQSGVDVLFNAEGGDPVLAPTGSVRDAYLEYSYGQLTLDSTVAYWVDLPYSEQYYAAGVSGLTTQFHSALRSALDVLDADPNFRFRDFDQDGDGQIDAITFLHSGYGAEWGGTDEDGTYYRDRIWSHKWAIGAGGWWGSEGVVVSAYHVSPALWGRSGSAIGRIGVICHETGHFLGLPDLYDTDGGGEGIGSYGLMANSWGFDGSQHYPPHPSAWSKIQLGWVVPTAIAPGSYSIDEAENSPSVYRVDLSYPPGEYLLIENRQPVGLDGSMPQGGLAIFHIDETAPHNAEGHPWQSGWPENGNHYRVALLQADGGYDLERGFDRGDAWDLFHANGTSEIGPGPGGYPNTDAYQYGNIVVTENTIFDISASGPTISFSFASSNGLNFECSDGVDNDGDGLADLDDPGCRDESGTMEDPRCQDGVDNDGDGKMDFDAGFSANGVPHANGPDAQCVDNPWKNGEWYCGLGAELAFLLPALIWVRQRRRRRA